MSQPAKAPNQLALKVPERVVAGQDFKVQISFPHAYKSIEFALVFDQPGIQLVSAPKSMEAAQAGQAIHLRASGDAGTGTPLVMPTLRANRTVAAPINVTVQDLHIKDGKGLSIAATVGLPSQFMVRQ